MQSCRRTHDSSYARATTSLACAVECSNNPSARVSEQPSRHAAQESVRLLLYDGSGTSAHPPRRRRLRSRFGVADAQKKH